MKKDTNQSNNSSGFKKNPFKKHLEEVELKKKKDSEEAAKVYADFLASFEDEDLAEDHSNNLDSSNVIPNFAPKTFVMGETINPSTVFKKESGFDSNTLSTDGNTNSRIYRPQVLSSVLPTEKHAPEIISNYKPKESGKKVRIMDEFLEELKKQHGKKEKQIHPNYSQIEHTTQKDKYIGDIFDSQSTSKLESEASYNNSNCLYVGNISPEVDEESICKRFGIYGAIASVKLVMPRNKDNRRIRPCAFVSFMNNSSALNAKNKLNGTPLLGQMIRIGWAKPTSVPEKPFYDPEHSSKSSYIESSPNVRIAAHVDNDLNIRNKDSKFSSFPVNTHHTESTPQLKIQVKIPQDISLLERIHKTIEYVLEHGYSFESHIIRKESSNMQFDFLHDFESEEHIYYRWKLYSLMQGESISNWTTKPVQISEGGPYFIPPPLNQTSSSLNDPQSESPVYLRNSPDQNDPLSNIYDIRTDEWVEFENQISELNLDRQKIGLAMVFAVDHVTQSEKVVNIIEKALLREGLEPVGSTAIIYLVSDILYNLSPTIPQAWKLRACFEQHLETFFLHLHRQYQSIAARLKAEAFRKQIANVLTLWESSLIFTPSYLTKLENILNHGQPELPSELANIPTYNPIYEDAIKAEQGEIIDEPVKVERKGRMVKRSIKRKLNKLREQTDEDDLDMFE